MNYLKYNLQDWIFPDIEFELPANGLRVLLLKIDRTRMPPKTGRRNLIAIDNNGLITWIAELPKSYLMYGSYHQIYFEDQIIKAICGSILCDLSPKTGKIINEKFIK